jgi:Mn2+/Fe2+ NRAMP family transporter
MGFSNLVALSILTSAAATLHKFGLTDIHTSVDAAKALEPIAGSFATLLFATGIIGTGLLAVPVLAGSAAYAVGEALHWPAGLGRRPREAKAFYATIALATLVGMLVHFAPVSPIRALFWSAVLNGVVAVPLMGILMLLATSPAVMGPHIIGVRLRLLGWTTFGVMLVADVVMIGTALG